MNALLLTATLALLAGNSDDTQTAAERLADHPWAAWTDGSWVKFEVKQLDSTVTATESLVSLGTDSYRLLGTSVWDGGEAENRFDHGYALLGYPQAQPGAQRVAEETVTVDGKSFVCDVWKARWKEDRQPYEAVAWVAAGYSHPLRVRQKGEGLSIDLEVAKLEDWIRIAGRKYRCVRYEGSTTYQGRSSRTQQWRTSEIPGGVARTVNRVTTPQGVVDHVSEVVEFRGTQRRR